MGLRYAFLPGGSSFDRHDGWSSGKGPHSPSEEPGHCRGQRKSPGRNEGRDSGTGSPSSHWATWRTANTPLRSGQAGGIATCPFGGKDDRAADQGEGEAHGRPFEEQADNFTKQGILVNDTCSVRAGSTFTCPSTELQGTAGRPHEVWIASAGTRQTEGLMPQQFNLDGNSDADMVSLEELSPEALRQLQEDAAHSMENVYQRAPGGPIWRHRSCLPDTRSEGGSAGSLSDPWKLHQELKKGQALLISQAWDKHKRDQAARFGVRADRIRNALVREFEANMSSYVNDEVFVHAIDMATCLNPSSQSAPSTSSLKTSSLDGPFVSEVYTNTQRVMREASKRGHRVGTPLSLETGWNFLLADHREQAKQLIRKEKPYFLIFSPLMHLNPSTNLEEILEKGRVLMNFALELAAIQISSSCFSGVCFASRCLVFGSHTAQQLTKFVRKYGSTADQVCEKAWSNS